MTTREIFEQRRQAVVGQITEHPETFDMDTWVGWCGTTHCIAGWALEHRGGVKVAFDPDGGDAWFEANGEELANAVIVPAAAEWFGLPLGER